MHLMLYRKKKDVTHLFYLPEDSLMFKDSILRHDLYKLHRDSGNYKDSLNRQINMWHKTYEELNLNSSNIRFDSVVLHELLYRKLGDPSYKLRVYFSNDSSRYYFDMNYFVKEGNRMAAFQLKPPAQIIIDSIGLNSLIGTGTYSWRVNGNDPRIFERIYIFLSNEYSKRNYYDIRYKVTLYKKKKKNGLLTEEKLFSKYYDYKDTLYNGEIVRIHLKDLDDFFFNDRITKKNFDLSVQITDYKPKAYLILNSESSINEE
jgi:hypothetical protein